MRRLSRIARRGSLCVAWGERGQSVVRKRGERSRMKNYYRIEAAAKELMADDPNLTDGYSIAHG